jgi:hypothetical protein
MSREGYPLIYIFPHVPLRILSGDEGIPTLYVLINHIDDWYFYIPLHNEDLVLSRWDILNKSEAIN